MASLRTLLAAAFVLAAASASALQATKVLVLPPQPAKDTVTPSWLGEAVADVLPRDLARLGVPVVDRVDRLRAHDALDMPVVPLTRATSVRLAEALGATKVITGTYERRDRELTLSLRILDIERAALSPPQIAKGPVDTALALVHGLAWDLALAGPIKPMGTREAFLANARSVPHAAFEAYGQGLSSSRLSVRMDQLRRALKLRPDFDEARVELARLAIEGRDYATVAGILGVVKDGAPLAREARFLEGTALLESGKNAEAAALFARLAEQEPTPGVLANQGLALLRTGTSAGSKVLHAAVEKAPAWMDLGFNLGWALLVEGDPAGAVFWLRGVTKQSPHDVNARVALSWALRKAGRADEAAEEWRGVALLGPPYDEMATPDLSQRLGRVMMAERPLVVDRTDLQLAATHVGRAEALLKANDVEGALRELTRASYLDPYSARAHALMARAHAARGDKEKAVNELQMSLWCQEDAAVRLTLARLLLDLGRTAQAQAEAHKVLRTDPGNDEARALSKATPPKSEDGG